MTENLNSQEKNLLTTAAGAPVVDNQNSMTAGPRGPLFTRCLVTRKTSTF